MLFIELHYYNYYYYRFNNNKIKANSNYLQTKMSIVNKIFFRENKNFYAKPV